MRAYESRNGVALRKRVRKVHAKAKFVGVTYLLGAIALAALACLSTFAFSNGTKLWVGSFWKAYKGIADKANWFGAIIATLYAFVLLTVFINVLRCFGKMGWLTRRSTRYVNGYNRNMRAMEKMGKIYSGSLAAIVNFHFLIHIASRRGGEIDYVGVRFAWRGVICAFLLRLDRRHGELFQRQRQYGYGGIGKTPLPSVCVFLPQRSTACGNGGNLVLLHEKL